MNETEQAIQHAVAMGLAQIRGEFAQTYGQKISLHDAELRDLKENLNVLRDIVRDQVNTQKWHGIMLILIFLAVLACLVLIGALFVKVY